AAVPQAVPSAPVSAPTSTSPEITGFDPDTGQVLDAAKYAHWRRDQLQVKEQESMTVYEAFLTAPKGLQERVDADARKPVVLAGDIGQIKQHPAVVELVQTSKGYGPTMVEKLSKHLDFLVDNRRQFYAAFAYKMA